MIFIVPSELRETSNLKRFISDVSYNKLPGLEKNTGADLMVSPDGLPLPHTDKLLQLHIDSGAKLIQYKFGHDLPLSIIDGRLTESLARMQMTGAMISQCILQFVGILGFDNIKGYGTVNGQLTYGKYPMKWYQIDAALERWIDRGGTVSYPLSSGKLIPLRLEGIQNRVNEYYSGRNTRKIAISAPKFEKVIEHTNPDLRAWKVAQRIEMIDDLRRFFTVIPGVKIGLGKANAIWDYMEENGIRQDLGGFLGMLKGSKPEILKVKGIGKTLVNNIQYGLWKTREEREMKNAEKND